LFFLAHPWKWHRRPRSRRACLARALTETAVLGVVFAVVAAWPWSPHEGHLALRVLGACLYGVIAGASVATMRRKP
jgi:hypothetical protein